MNRTFKFLLRPTSKQVLAMSAMLEDHRQLYNAALQERRDAWRKHRVPVKLAMQQRQLPDIRAFDPDQARWSATSQQMTICRLNIAFERFFRRVQTGGAPGYPRFKGPGQFNAVSWPSPNRPDGRADGCRWDSTPNDRVTRVYFKGVGHVRVNQHRKVAGHIKQVHLKRCGRQWYVYLSCDRVPAKPLPPTGSAVGIDLGIVSLLMTSDGARIENPRFGKKAESRIQAANRVMTAATPGTARRRKARERYAAAHAKVRRQRLDHAHKVALWLVRHHDFIAHEALQVRNMLRRPKRVSDGEGGWLPNGATRKSTLNRHINDAGWGILLRCLHDKAESAGRVVVAVDPRNTSRRCPSCGHCESGNRITQADFICVPCGFDAHADFVGAMNVLRAGLALRGKIATPRESAPGAEESRDL